ncbi:MAG: chemotaxis protein CheW [Pseudomonadota bacterium]
MEPRATRGVTAAQAVPAQEFLAFRLGSEEYGIDILRVQEIRSYESPTRIAGAPNDLLGVINLRGVIVPIIDMRLNLRLEQATYDSHTAVIVLGVAGRVIGLVVDSVSDVIELAPEQINPVPELGESTAHALRGIGSLEGRMLLLLDIDTAMQGAVFDATATASH